MDVQAAVRARGAELRRTDVDHCQPWLPILLGDDRWVGRVSDAVAATGHDDDDHLAAATTPFVRMKNNTSARQMLLVPLETDVRMAAQSRDLVDAIESVRRPNSFGAPIHAHEAGVWAKLPFNDQRADDGPYRKWQRTLGEIRTSHLWVAITDVRRFFGSLHWWPTMDFLARLLGIDDREVLRATRLHGRVWEYSPIRGMPIGCDVSSVVGNVLLTGVDDELLWFATSASASARWMDDITFGCPTEEFGRAMCDQIERGPLRELHLLINRDKTKIEPTPIIRLVASDVVDVDGSTESQIDAHEARERLASLPSGAQLPKNISRPLIDAVVGSSMDVEQRAQIIAHAAGHVLAGNDNELPRRLRGLFDGQPPPPDIVDRVIDGLERTTVPGTPSDGEAAELLLNLADPQVQVGSRGVRALRRLMADGRQDRTRAVAAWVLADAADEFDRQVLEDLDGFSVACARGVVGAMRRAGGRPSGKEWAAAAPANQVR